jgi:hypothetical protein
MKRKNRKNIWFIILAFILVFSTGQICTGWGGNGEDNGSEDVREAGEGEADDEETGEEEDEEADD